MLQWSVHKERFRNSYGNNAASVQLWDILMRIVDSLRT